LNTNWPPGVSSGAVVTITDNEAFIFIWRHKNKGSIFGSFGSGLVKREYLYLVVTVTGKSDCAIRDGKGAAGGLALVFSTEDDNTLAEDFYTGQFLGNRSARDP